MTRARWIVKKATRAACAIGGTGQSRLRRRTDTAAARAVTYHRFFET
ncbi:MAG: hypothetical protein R3B99_10130 [Polyangiales bacterium]